MLKLKSIYIDGLHNAVNKTYPLNDLVYLYGRNGAGKTTVLYGIQLALLGYIPGVHKTKEAILKHAKAEKITVRLELDNDGSTVTIERTYGKSSKTTILPSDFDIQSIIADIELPIFDFNEFVGQTANKLKEYFIKNLLPISEGGLDWNELLRSGLLNVNVENPEETITYGMNLISGVSGTPLEQVAQANKIFKDEQSFNRSELTRLQATVDSLIYYSDYAGPKDMNEITTKLLSLGALRDTLIRYETAKQMCEKNQSELGLLKQTYAGMGGSDECLRIRNKINSDTNEYIEIRGKVTNLSQSMSELKVKRSNLGSIITQQGICPYTKTKCGSLDLNVVENTVSNLDITISELNRQIAEWSMKSTELENKIREGKANLTKFQDMSSQITALEKSLAALPTKPDTDKTIMDIDREIQQYDEAKTKLHANQVYEETINNITNLKYKAELNNDALAAWIKLTDTNGLQTSLAEKPFEELANTMTGYIQNMYGDTGLKAKFEVSTKANSFSFGLIRDNKYIAYEQLSSGEKCLYTLALMICISNSGKSPLKLLLCDDMFDHLDSVSIENTFTALKNVSDIQFIFAGVKDCKAAEDVMIHI